jgi:hypothetical protein
MKLEQAGIGAEGAEQRRARSHDEIFMWDAPSGDVDLELAHCDVGG